MGGMSGGNRAERRMAFADFMDAFATVNLTGRIAPAFVHNPTIDPNSPITQPRQFSKRRYRSAERSGKSGQAAVALQPGGGTAARWIASEMSNDPP